jgi:predicted polyphosphate/ATP-dependent NAD kinase
VSIAYASILINEPGAIKANFFPKSDDTPIVVSLGLGAKSFLHLTPETAGELVDELVDALAELEAAAYVDDGSDAYHDRLVDDRDQLAADREAGI